MKQKLAVARTLMHRPELIFLDEPTAGLDPVASVALRDDLALLVAREGVTIFLTTHNLVEAEKLCARVAVINRGQLLAIGSPSELRSRTLAPRLYVSGQGISSQVAEELKNIPLVKAGVQIDEVRKEKVDLEDVFLQLVEEDGAPSPPPAS